MYRHIGLRQSTNRQCCEKIGLYLIEKLFHFTPSNVSTVNHETLTDRQSSTAYNPRIAISWPYKNVYEGPWSCRFENAYLGVIQVAKNYSKRLYSEDQQSQ